MSASPPETNLGPEGLGSRLSVSLRVAGDALDPAEVTRVLGVEPDFSARKGEERRQRAGTVVQRTGIWTRRLRPAPSADWDLDGVITALLAEFPADPAVWRELGSRYKLDVFCGLFMGSENQGADLSPATLLALGQRGLILDLDVYGPPPGEAAT
jgi:hypothetical protein